MITKIWAITIIRCYLKLVLLNYIMLSKIMTLYLLWLAIVGYGYGWLTQTFDKQHSILSIVRCLFNATQQYYYRPHQLNKHINSTFNMYKTLLNTKKWQSENIIRINFATSNEVVEKVLLILNGAYGDIIVDWVFIQPIWMVKGC